MKNATSGKEMRAPIYTIVERIADRELTVTEHNELKSAIIGYSEGQEKRIEEMNQLVQKQGSKAKALGRSLYNVLQRKGVPAAEIAFLKPLFETADTK